MSLLSDERRKMIDQWERGFLLKTLQENGGNVTAAAKILGVSRRYMHRRLNEQAISVHDRRAMRDAAPAFPGVELEPAPAKEEIKMLGGVVVSGGGL